MASPTETVLLSIMQARVLSDEQLAELHAWVAKAKPDTNGLGRELVQRQWLTPYQIKEIYKGRGKELMIGAYLVLEILGEGGMGLVYKAKQVRLGRTVALKVIKKEKLSNPQAVIRFSQEVHAAAQLSHPNVVMAFDAESTDGNLFLSMEFVEGTDLTKLIRQFGAMPLPQACDAIRQAALGLQHAHERGLVHRDIKPSNLLYTPRGQVKLLDLGLALLQQPQLSGAEAARITQDGFVIGTPDFLAPEQARDPGKVDIRADIYALGATLYYLLTARVPYESDSPTDKLILHVTAPPPSLLAVRPEMPPQLDAIIQWIMAKRPEDRPQTPAQVAAALAPFCATSSTVTALPASPVERSVAPSAFAGIDDDDAETLSRSPRKRKAPKTSGASSLPLLIIGAAVAFIVVGVATFGLLWFLNRRDVDESPLVDRFDAIPGLTLVKLEAGQFTMGSPDREEGRRRDEGPLHPVAISQAFYLGEREVSREQYIAVTGNAAGPPPNRAGALANRMPATGIAWDDAVAFCKKLNQKDPNRRAGWEYRLPTEAEWEYAARAGSDRPFAFGNRLVQHTHGIFRLEADDSYGEVALDPDLKKNQFEDMPCPISAGTKDKDAIYRRQPNAFGLFDLHGNVWEWCGDHFADYSGEELQTDPTGPTSGGTRVARGGAFDGIARDCRSAIRREEAPTAKAANLGFRIAFARKPN